MYCDLKPQNVLLDENGQVCQSHGWASLLRMIVRHPTQDAPLLIWQVRISDMGLTANISKGAIKQCSGTRGYWSPETIKKEAYTTEPDWWSLGVTMFALLSMHSPFSLDIHLKRRSIDFIGGGVDAARTAAANATTTGGGTTDARCDGLA